MNVLGYIAAFNDKERLDRCIQGLLYQTYPVKKILVVDNGSSDGTSQKTFPKEVTLLCHKENRGTSGAVVTGFNYAISKGYDWMWVFDADSVPHTDALKNLVELFNVLPPEIQNKIRVLGSLPVDVENQRPHHGIMFTTKANTKGFIEVNPDPNVAFYECDSIIWSGSLFNLKAVKQIGLPIEDYVLDWGDHEYGYRGKEAGYKTFMSQLSIIDHNLHPIPTVRSFRLGPVSFSVFTSPPIRRYYFFRNILYFWLYEYHCKNLSEVLLPYFWLLRFVSLMARILILNKNPRLELWACLRGIRDGIGKKLHRRY
jgi:rhamnosyltransferase